MTAPADPIEILRRLSALSGAGRPVPPDLVTQALDWLADAAPKILSGESPAAALGLHAQRGAWQNSPVHRARLDQRNAAICDLWRLTTGPDADRVEVVHGWLDQFREFTTASLAPDAARRLRDSIPADAWPFLEAIADTGLRVPGSGALLRVVRSASNVAGDIPGCGLIDSTPHGAACRDHA